MDSDKAKGKGKKNLLLKTWDRCRSLPRERSKSSTGTFTKSKSRQNDRASPEGCFSVYVGPEKQRFVIKTKYANHPLFKMLLEDAEEEYGYSSEGPLLLPCDVDLFCKVLAEMDGKEEETVPRCGFAHGSCSPFAPGRRVGRNGNMAKVYGSNYGLDIPLCFCVLQAFNGWIKIDLRVTGCGLMVRFYEKENALNMKVYTVVPQPSTLTIKWNCSKHAVFPSSVGIFRHEVPF
ncbi:hypothetical protein RHSIM_Rhsim08G0192900 [Rhododendron simsii]|uniref:SAUR-like auxin-responsive protein family n=1 Tax=Rhododendron simsii TaxID=118357 RepID=A0A834LJJ5_RHOSS|nr:hypothetical protein RHSIM_Rhsim08G0192900 [Rhododendron simsii]